MENEKDNMFRNRLVKVFRHLGKQARRQGITCFRLYDHDLPEFPFCIEFYENNIYLAEYKRRLEMADELHELWLENCINIISEVLAVGTDHIFIKQRKRKPGRLGQYQKIAEEEIFFEVHENDLKFKVNLTDYLDTGLFLDHRITRSTVKADSKDKRVLNLFCYTGSFSVYAAAGDAKTVVSVDLSKTYLNWAQENMHLNQLYEEQKQLYVQADVKQYLEKVLPSSFDLIIIDPPTFSNSKRMKDFLDIQRDHVELLNQCLYALSPGGIIYFSTNFSRFQLESESIRASEIKDITKATTPFDFQGKLSRWCYRILK